MAKNTLAQAEHTRQLIMDTAMKLFAQHGYRETTLSEIAATAEITRGAIYWHFKDKLDLLTQLCITLDDKQELNIDLQQAGDPAEPDPLGRLRAFLLAHSHPNNREFFSSSIFALIERILMNEPENPLYDKLYQICQQHKQSICNVLKNAVDKHQLPDTLQVELAADHIGIFIGGLIQLIHLNMTEGVFKHFDKLVDALILGLHQLTADVKESPTRGRKGRKKRLSPTGKV